MVRPVVKANMIRRSQRGARRAVVAAARRLGVRRFGQQVSRRLAREPRSVAHRPYLAASPLPTSLEVAEWMAFRGLLFADAVVPLDVGGSPVVAVAVLFE